MLLKEHKLLGSHTSFVPPQAKINGQTIYPCSSKSKPLIAITSKDNTLLKA